MALPGASQVALLGSVIISAGAAVDMDPFLVATVMLVITGVMEGMPSSLALGCSPQLLWSASMPAINML